MTGEPTSPLAGWQGQFEALPETVRLRELPFLTQLNLRLDPAGPAAGPVAAVLGAALPTGPCTALHSGENHLLWLGPDEWLVLAPPGAASGLERALRTAIADEHGSVTDVSAQRTSISLTGPGARELLAKGCSIDLHPKVSPSGTCVQTLLAQTGIVIVVNDATDFLLLVRSSFAGYLAAWLVDACTEIPSLA